MPKIYDKASQHWEIIGSTGTREGSYKILEIREQRVPKKCQSCNTFHPIISLLVKLCFLMGDFIIICIFFIYRKL